MLVAFDPSGVHRGTVANCQRSHELLKGTFEQLDPCVQMQLSSNVAA